MLTSITRLRAFVTVVRAESMAAAAGQLGLTSSALSQQIAKLESESGGRLLVRTAAGARPTRIGEVLLRHAERVLGELRDAEEALCAAVGGEPQSLSVASFATAAKALLPEPLAALRRHHPDIQLSLLDLEPPRGYDLIASRDLDLLITHRYPGVPLPPAAGLRRECLLTDPLVLVAPPEHRSTELTAVSLSELEADEWISGAPGVPNRVCLEAAAETAGIRPRVAYETHDYEVTLALIAAGIGVALVPRMALRHSASAEVVARPLSGVSLEREIHAVHRPEPPPLANGFLDILRRYAGELPTV